MVLDAERQDLCFVFIGHEGHTDTVVFKTPCSLEDVIDVLKKNVLLSSPFFHQNFSHHVVQANLLDMALGWGHGGGGGGMKCRVPEVVLVKGWSEVCTESLKSEVVLVRGWSEVCKVLRLGGRGWVVLLELVWL